MKKKYYPFETRFLGMCKRFTTSFNGKCMMALLLITFAAGCKKVMEDPGVIGVCPVIVSTDPLDKAVDVVLDKTITATFNTDLNAVTINSTSFSIKQGTQIISGTVSPTANAAVYTFKPDVALLPFTKYTGTITNAAADKFKTTMVSNYVWSFTTIPLVTLSVNLAAGGTVAGAGTFAQGSTVTMSAVPKTGYTFTNWIDSGTTNIASTSPSYQFVMAGNRALIANFTIIPPAQYAVMLSSVPIAGGSTYGSGSYNTGTSVTVIESPNNGYSFVSWTENGTVVSTNSSYQFTITGNRTLVANFSLIPALQYAVILTSAPPAGGGTTGSGTYVSGSSVTITATPVTGYTFVNWTDLASGAVVSASSPYVFNLTTNRTLVANFSINTYTLNVTAVNGTIIKNPNQLNYNYGTAVQVTATPNAGYTFTSWSGDASGNTNPLLVTMNANRNITANFTQNGYTLNVTAVNGTVAKNPSQPTYTLGSTVVLTATANAGYVFSSWSGDTTAVTNPLTVTINSNKNITANFAAVVPLVSLGTAANFGAMGGSAGITNQGINTVINNGGLATTAVSTLVTGFHDNTGDKYIETPLNIGNVTGRIYTDAPPPVIFGPGGPYGGTAATKAIADQALADANAAYISISPASKPGGTDPGAGELGGLVLAPGIYKAALGTFKITLLDLVLDAKGDPNAVWIFQTAAGLTVGNASNARSITMVNGGLPKNVFWYVGSSAVINYAGGGTMVGTIIANSGVSISSPASSVTGPQSVLNGRALSLVSSVTMVNTTINNQ